MLLVSPLSLSDVEQEALPIERFAVRTANCGALFANPDDATVAREQAVLGLDRGCALRRALGLSEDAFAVLGVQELGEQVWFCFPLLRRVTEHRLALGAQVAGRAAIARVVQPSHEGKRPHESSIFPLSPIQLLADPEPLRQTLPRRSTKALGGESGRNCGCQPDW